MLQRIAKLLGFNAASNAPRDGFVYFDKGETVPADGAVGYGTGCIFQKTNGGAGSSFYVNEGTGADSDFNVSVGVLGALSVITSMIDNLAVTAGKIAAGAVITAKLAAGAVVGTKLAATGITGGSFTGHNNVGACTLAGATVGQRVLALFEIDTSSGTVGEQSKFESTITVNDQIQQTDAGNLSAKKYAVILLPVAA